MKTLKCDFHIHTVFSDGKVWPSVRVREAWLEGLDAIAITDHIEYLPHKADLPIVDYNRSYEIAEKEAKALDFLLIKAAEITRSMPPGHFNALFIEDPNLLQEENVYDVLKEAKRQGAFLLWDHPGWEPMAPDGIKWYDEHTRLMEQGMLNGIEVYNSLTYYPEALTWAINKDLTVFANTDLHEPVNLNFDIVNSHRPMTLVFAKDNSLEALKEALFDRRTVAYFGHTLAGPEKWLRQLFNVSVLLDRAPLKLNEKGTATQKITNQTDFNIVLELSGPQPKGASFPEKIVLNAHRSTQVKLVKSKGVILSDSPLTARYKVTNFYIGEGEKLEVELAFQP